MSVQPKLRAPEAIEAESFRIIEEELGPHGFSPDEFQIIRRVIHATADFEFARNLVFHPDAIARAMQAIRRGCDLVVDVAMIQAGVSKPALASFGNGRVLSFITDPDVVEEAKREGITRAIASMRKAARAAPDAIYAIGNAPTALFEAIRLVEEKQMAPALIVGVPVGFVSAVESKDALIASGYPHIAARGRKGGTPVAVAALNALLALAKSA
ncbi:MAG: precorrin-8X methylmutase [Candidatus Lindowbacteria bacterium RIFCSPLOWO2_12_FULL_62_27]|nr:MAG: precorrin-8X methylmutase [Candidatus Lindowbacteria bacterium RIFCSPLOWO2_12_FULL_62_27]OGH61503.1 MAG: precorrin-8X methylmutase [Candidatus Lindowbacteria bacterium RIFCSPLOWO2_02_FULL_62_12]